ncbi:MAG: peptidase M22 [Clostridia bacterium]|nr:peptidase M22 [Clostridia bacterium]
MISLGIDTSNYTTSVALFDSGKNEIISKKKLLPVKKGEKGLRQSDAVFHHTVQLPSLIEELFVEFNGGIDCIGVSSRPCDKDGSYMPCFLTGVSVAESLGSVFKKNTYEFSHQQGHIAAVLQSTNNTELFNKEFIAFHVSGGTTEAVYVKPDNEKIISTELIYSSSDLKAGQAIDRIALSLGLDFPGGKELDILSRKSTAQFRIKPSVRDNTFSLSGVENKCLKMLEENEKKEDIAKYCIDYISVSLESAVKYLLNKYGNLPLVFSGGVMSNSLIRERFTSEFGAIFAEPEFSSDNALGVAVLANIKESNNG